MKGRHGGRRRPDRGEPVVRVGSVEGLMEAAHGYQRSMTLFVALALGVFDALAAGGADARSLARRLGVDAGRVEPLLNALVALGLLRKRGGRYRNGPVAAAHLAEGPRSKASILLHHRDCWTDWLRLEEKVRAGRSAPGEGGRDEQENFIRGMEDNARERAAAVAKAMPLRPGERVLDLGGGPGTYAVEWARRYPAAEIALFDTPETLRVTRAILREKGAEGRVRLLEGDFLVDPLGGPYDFVWISQILHAYAENDCRRLLRKARRALAPGGRIAVQEFLVDEDGTRPPGPAFFSVHMVAVTEGGRTYRAREIEAMLTAAGFATVRAGRPDARGVGIIRAESARGPSRSTPPRGDRR